MSLHLMTLFTAHPAKLINLLALLFAFPGGWLLHATRRRELRAMASLQAQRQSRANEEPMLDWATLRMNLSSIPMSRNREYRPERVAPTAPPTTAPGGPSITAPAITPIDPPRAPPLRPLTS